MSNFQWGGYTAVNKSAAQVQPLTDSSLPALPAVASKSSLKEQTPSNWKQTHLDRDPDRSGGKSSLTALEQPPPHLPPTSSSRQDASTKRQKSDFYRADILSAEKKQQAITEEISSEMDTDEDVPLAQLNSHANTKVQPVGKAKTPSQQTLVQGSEVHTQQSAFHNRAVKPVPSENEDAVSETTSDSDNEIDNDSYIDDADRDDSASTVQEEQQLVIPRSDEVYRTFEAFKTSVEIWHATTFWSSEELRFNALRLSVTCKRDNSHGCTFEIRLKSRKHAEGFKIAMYKPIHSHNCTGFHGKMQRTEMSSTSEDENGADAAVEVGKEYSSFEAAGRAIRRWHDAKYPEHKRPQFHRGRRSPGRYLPYVTCASVPGEKCSFTVRMMPLDSRPGFYISKFQGHSQACIAVERARKGKFLHKRVRQPSSTDKMESVDEPSVVLAPVGAATLSQAETPQSAISQAPTSQTPTSQASTSQASTLHAVASRTGTPQATMASLRRPACIPVRASPVLPKASASTSISRLPQSDPSGSSSEQGTSAPSNLAVHATVFNNSALPPLNSCDSNTEGGNVLVGPSKQAGVVAGMTVNARSTVEELKLPQRVCERLREQGISTLNDIINLNLDERILVMLCDEVCHTAIQKMLTKERLLKVLKLR